MRLLLTIACVLVIFAPLQAQRLAWRPSDFKPLVAVPWDAPDKTMADVLQTIFREPDSEIRYPVLAAYLEKIPVSKMEEAFQTCVRLEGCQNPDDLVNHFLNIWGRRDPEAAWKKARTLFDAIVIEGEPLGLDSWKDREPTRVVDWEGFRQSNLWLSDLNGVGMGIENSGLPLPEKTRLLKEFADLTIDRLGVLPRPYLYQFPIDSWSSPGVVEALGNPVAKMADFVTRAPSAYTPAAIRAGLIRWLDQKPADALEILRVASSIKMPPGPNNTPAPDVGTPTIPFLMLWAKLDQSAMLRWSESQHARGNFAATEARGLLMSRVNEDTRQRWIREALGTGVDDDARSALFGEWAHWDPERSLQAAVATQNVEIINRAAEGAVYSFSYAWNGSHHGLGVIRDFDIGAVMAVLPESDLNYMRDQWGYSLMEQWVDIDVGEAARYGFQFLADARNAYIPRENLIKLLSGDDEFSSDSDMIDRAFCALRFWSVWKPEEMRKWIATLSDPEMQQALTWLLEHPKGQEKGPDTK